MRFAGKSSRLASRYAWRCRSAAQPRLAFPKEPGFFRLIQPAAPEPGWARREAVHRTAALQAAALNRKYRQRAWRHCTGCKGESLDAGADAWQPSEMLDVMQQELVRDALV